MEDKEKKDEDVKKEKEKKRIKYPPPEDGSFIIKDSCPQFREVTYPEPKGGETMIKRDLDTHRVQLKQIRNVPNIKLSVPEDVVKFVREMEDYDRERFKVIYLDNKTRVIGVENISEGTLNAALIHPREAVKGAVLANAAGVMLIHNHPSGIPTPSIEDDSIRTKLTEGFRLLGIDVIDALIIGKEGYYSYKEAGRMPGKGIEIIEGVMETKKVDEKCDIAMKAAMSTIKDYCGDDVAQMAVMERKTKPLDKSWICYELTNIIIQYIEDSYITPNKDKAGYDFTSLENTVKSSKVISDNEISCSTESAIYLLAPRSGGDVQLNVVEEIMQQVKVDINSEAIKDKIIKTFFYHDLHHRDFTLTDLKISQIEVQYKLIKGFTGESIIKFTRAEIDNAVSIGIKLTVNMTYNLHGGDETKRRIDEERREQRKSSEKMWDEKP